MSERRPESRPKAAPRTARRTRGIDTSATSRATAVAMVGLGPLGHAGATLGVLSTVVGLAVEGVFLERVSHRQVMLMLPESRPSRHEVLSSEGVRG